MGDFAHDTRNSWILGGFLPIIINDIVVVRQGIST